MPRKDHSAVDQTASSSTRSGAKRQAVELLLAWGFGPAAIAQQVGCSIRYVYAVRRDTEQHTDRSRRTVGTSPA